MPLNLGEMIPNDDGNSRAAGHQRTAGVWLDRDRRALLRGHTAQQSGGGGKYRAQDTAGGIHPISAKFDLLEKGQYTVNITPDQLPATTADKKTPLELLEAQNAIAIAQAAGADQYAVDTLGKAKAYLAQGQDYSRRKQKHHAHWRGGAGGHTGGGRRAAADAPEEAAGSRPQRNGNGRRTVYRPAQSQAEQSQRGQTLPAWTRNMQLEQRELADQERQAAQQAGDRLESGTGGATGSTRSCRRAAAVTAVSATGTPGSLCSSKLPQQAEQAAGTAVRSGPPTGRAAGGTTTPAPA